MRGEPDSRPDEAGFTLVEVLVSLALLATTTAAMGPFFVRSFQIVAQQRGHQAAVELANSAVEQVRALKGSSLLTGRGRLASTEQWQDAYDDGPVAIRSYLDVPNRPVGSQTNRKLTMRFAWDELITDPASTLGADAAISTLPQTMVVQGMSYTRTIFVGECDTYLENVPGYLKDSGDCVNPEVVAPPADGTKVLKFFRAVVLITWPDQTCGTGRCSHIASTLVSSVPDEPVFDFHRPAPLVGLQTAVFYVGLNSSYQLVASGGQLPNTWALAGTLPAGLTMTPAGVISGVAQAPVTLTLPATVTDSTSRSDTEPVTIKVVPPPTVTVPTGLRHRVGDQVTQQLTAANGLTPYAYAATGLPPGLSLDPETGAITGTVTTAGSYPVTVTVGDLNGTKGTGTYTHVVFAPVQLAPVPDRSIDLGTAFSATAVAHGGDGAYTYGATGLPLGVTIDASTGAMSGLPTVPGRYLITVTVTDARNDTYSDTFALVVTTSTALTFTAPAFATADQTSAAGDPVSVALTTNADLLGLKPKIDVTGLPDGLKVSLAKDLIYGEPATAGTHLVTVEAIDDKSGQTAVLTFRWTVT